MANRAKEPLAPAEIERRLGTPGLLGEVRAALQDAFGRRFRGLVLYGSRARGDENSYSDLDMLVLLEGPVEWGSDLTTAIEATREAQDRVLVMLSVRPVDARLYEEQYWPLYRSAREEGISL